mmetsp:Transcript_30147/g.76388  ORF Transcript_30147/g.76388 Transcript_30147/m.76388 type:complete len:277 (+) Transcript_30147:570-1400(+)
MAARFQEAPPRVAVGGECGRRRGHRRGGRGRGGGGGGRRPRAQHRFPERAVVAPRLPPPLPLRPGKAPAGRRAPVAPGLGAPLRAFRSRHREALQQLLLPLRPGLVARAPPGALPRRLGHLLGLLRPRGGLHNPRVCLGGEDGVAHAPQALPRHPPPRHVLLRQDQARGPRVSHQGRRAGHREEHGGPPLSRRTLRAQRGALPLRHVYRVMEALPRRALPGAHLRPGHQGAAPLYGEARGGQARLPREGGRSHVGVPAGHEGGAVVCRRGRPGGRL